MSTASDTAAGTAPRAGRRGWIGLAVLALPCMLYSMDLTVLNLAVPSLSADLAPTSTQLLWIVDIYGFLVAGALITMGTLGDRIGRRRLLLIGAAAFGAASVLAAFSVSAEMLIATRALLGLAGATIAPSTLSLIRNIFHDPRQRTVAIGVWITSYSVGAAIGPLVGGVLLQHFWWGVGLAPVFTLANDVVIGTAPPERAGAASAISETSSELGGALGIAILGSIGATLYRSAMADAVPPGVPPEAAEAARGTLGGAVGAAAQLHDRALGDAFLGTAREAFTRGLQLAAVVSAVTVAVMAVLATVVLRRARGPRTA
jgi:MFS transporter, DHA2 family, multidrug resistance protein